ncbi:hypothetical protein EP331_14820 [bacterium]|nr:MAG: hypothetical protein EP331_14820 [bacterium]
MKVNVKNSPNWYNPDKEYLVLGIEIYLYKLDARVRLYSDINECPALVKFEDLVVTDSYIPEEWISVHDTQKNIFKNGYPKFYETNFWVNYFDEECEEIEYFREFIEEYNLK